MLPNINNRVTTIQHYYDDVKLHGESFVMPVRYCSLGVTQLWRAPWHYDNKMARLVELVCRAAAAIVCSGLFISTAAISFVGLSIKCINERRQLIKPGIGKDQVESKPIASSLVVSPLEPTPVVGTATAVFFARAEALPSAAQIDNPVSLVARIETKDSQLIPLQAEGAQGNILDMSQPAADQRGVVNVPGDGHCLYYSMRIGLTFLLPKLQKLGLPNGCILPANGGTLPDVPTLRTLANNYIRAHHATDPVLQGYVREAIAAANAKYIAAAKAKYRAAANAKYRAASKDGVIVPTNFLSDKNSITQVESTQHLAGAKHKYRSINNPEEYFVRATEEPAFWGSQAECYALSHVYQTTIQIIEDDGNDLIQARPPVNREYLKHHAAVRLGFPSGYYTVLSPAAVVKDITTLPEEEQEILRIVLAADGKRTNYSFRRLEPVLL